MTRTDLVLSPQPSPEPPEALDVHPSSASNGLLWFAVLGGPAFWTLDELAAFFWHQSWCAASIRYGESPFSGEWIGLVIIGLIGIAGIVAAGLAGWRVVRDMGHDTGRNGTVTDRRRFMGHAGMIMSILFLFGTLLRFIAIFFVSFQICNLGS
jgi:hypothetical protein